MRIILALCCLLAGCAAPAPEPPPLVGAVGFEKLDLVVVNRDTRAWDDATLTINPDADGGYSTTVSRIAAGERVAVPSGLFANPSGLRFNAYTVKPITFRLTATVDGQAMTWTTPFSYGTP